MEIRNAEPLFSSAARRTKEHIRQFALNRQERLTTSSTIKKKFKAHRLLLTSAKTTLKLTTSSARYRMNSDSYFSKIPLSLLLKKPLFTSSKSKKGDECPSKTPKDALDTVNIFMHRPGELHFKTFQKEIENEGDYLTAVKSNNLRNCLATNKLVEFNKLKFSKFDSHLTPSPEWDKLTRKNGDMRVSSPYHTT